MLIDALTERRLDLLQQLRRAQQDMNHLFGRLPLLHQGPFPAVNVWAGVDGALVVARVPGVDPDQIEVTVHQDVVTLHGERSALPQADGVIVHRRERVEGPFSRSIALPFRVDANGASARFAAGVLTLELPRPTEDKPRQLRIVAG